MDPNEAYRLLCEAMGRLRPAVDSASPEALLDAEDDVRSAVDRWDDLNGWMCKSGFPPVAWNNPVTVLTQGRFRVEPLGVTGEVIDAATTPIPEHMRPVRGHDRLCSLMVFGGACDCNGIERS